MKLNYNATHFECFSSTFHYATCFLPIPQSRLAGYDGRTDTIISIPGFYFVPSLTFAHGLRMSHHGDLFNVGHGSENGKRQPHKKIILGSCWPMWKRLGRKTMLCIISIFHLALFEEIERNENEKKFHWCFCTYIYHFTWLLWNNASSDFMNRRNNYKDPRKKSFCFCAVNYCNSRVKRSY